MGNFRKALAMGLATSIFAFAACNQSGGSPDADTSDAASVEAEQSFANVNSERIINANATPGEWLSYGRSYDEQRHSPLTSINTENVDTLGVAWTYDLQTERGVESTPIVVDGTMYVTSAWSVVYALDAVTGEELWTFDPGVDRSRGVAACCDVVNRGVAVWEGKIFVGTIDGRLVALDAKTGDVVWDKVTVDQSQPYTITGAPRVVKGNVLIGNGGAELGVRGYVSAYDANTGEMNWRFYTAPNPNKEPDGAVSDAIFASLANDTWGDEGAWTEVGGGGTTWDAIVHDPELNLIYLGVGNGSPWNQQYRDPSGGDNLFLSSIVALNADTGEYVWHFQTTPGETWDYTATQHIMLADLPLGENGADRRVVMQAPKNGFFYVLDAATGEFISGEPFAVVNWATGLDENGRPIEVEAARFKDEPYLQLPSPFGAHNWHPMAYSPKEQLVYIPAQEMAQLYATDPEFEVRRGTWNVGTDMDASPLPASDVGAMKAIKASMTGSLLAWDPIAQEARWEVEHGMPWNGGILSTAGDLVFQGRMDGKFAAYNAATGEELWSTNVKSGALSGPGTFEIDGEQYVTITTGWGSVFPLNAGFFLDESQATPKLGKVVTFKLGGTGEIADYDFAELPKVPATEAFGTEEQIALGEKTYYQYCQVCHGLGAIGGGTTPDLRWSQIAGNQTAWQSVVLDGTLADNGMVGFSQHINTDEAEALRAFIIHRAHEDAPDDAGGQQ